MEDRKLGEFNDFLLVDHGYMTSYVLEYAFRHNYTNREAICDAIETRYTFWPDSADTDAIRQEFIDVRIDHFFYVENDIISSSQPMPTMWHRYCCRHICMQAVVRASLCMSIITTFREVC